MRMAVPVMQVGIMGVPVDHRRMAMPMAVRLTRRDARRVIMLVMCVVDMAMLVFERFVGMFVAVRFGQVQPKSNRHQDARDDERHGDGFTEHRHREQRADERRGREIGT